MESRQIRLLNLTFTGMLFGALFSFGCVVDSQTETWENAPDPELFLEVAMPVLSLTCANPACHGNPTRPFEIYAVNMHRVDSDSVHSDYPLTQKERWLNYQRTVAFVVGAETPEDSVLLRKPLSEEAGGMGHTAGSQFQDESNNDYQALLEWVRSGDVGVPQ